MIFLCLLHPCIESLRRGTLAFIEITDGMHIKYILMAGFAFHKMFFLISSCNPGSS